MTWNSRLLPHPLLAPWTDDYPDGQFEAIIPRSVISNGITINITIQYRLGSEALRSLIVEGQADYAALVACSNTFCRELILSSQREFHDFTLHAEDYAKSIVITPYVVATGNISNFLSDEHNDEIRQLKSEGFDIHVGSILSIGDSTRLTLEHSTPYSVIDLVPNAGTDWGTFDIDLKSDRIKIYLNPDDKAHVERFRHQDFESTGQIALSPSIYLHAVAEGLRNLSEYPDTDWAMTMRDALDRNGIVTDDDDIRANSLKYAQRMMSKPVGRMLITLAGQDEDR